MLADHRYIGLESTLKTDMQIAQQLLFAVALGVTAWLMSKRIGIIKKTIQLGKSDHRT